MFSSSHVLIFPNDVLGRAAPAVGPNVLFRRPDASRILQLMTTLFRTHRDLDVFRTAMDLAVEVHHLAARLPAVERHTLTEQILRSSRSVPANIAEMWRKRSYVAHFRSKLTDAQAEAAETQSWLELSRRIDYITPDTFNELFRTYETVISQLATMWRDAHKWTRGR